MEHEPIRMKLNFAPEACRDCGPHTTRVQDLARLAGAIRWFDPPQRGVVAPCLAQIGRALDDWRTARTARGETIPLPHAEWGRRWLVVDTWEALAEAKADYSRQGGWQAVIAEAVNAQMPSITPSVAARFHPPIYHLPQARSKPQLWHAMHRVVTPLFAELPGDVVDFPLPEASRSVAKRLGVNLIDLWHLAVDTLLLERIDLFRVLEAELSAFARGCYVWGLHVDGTARVFAPRDRGEEEAG